MAARLTLEGASATSEDWEFAATEMELVKISTEDVPVSVVRRSVPALLHTKLFVSAWIEWSRYRRFGLPHAAGWKREKAAIVRVIEVLEQEFEAFQADQMEN